MSSSKSVQNNKSFFSSFEGLTARLICWILIIIIVEICMIHFTYKKFLTEIQREYVAKDEFSKYFIETVESEVGRNKIQNIIKSYDSKETVKTTSRVKREMQMNMLESTSDEPHVEFFKPEVSKHLQNKDDIVRQQTGKGTAPGGDSWVWLTSYSRIPEKALEGYCKKIQMFCPPGKPGLIGPPGIPGLKGDKGEKGIPGIPGPTGIRGLPGIPGPKGEQGRAGHDGRDGYPGEPGLDGLPGRNGHDGKDGTPGTSGRDGRNGLDGSQGPQGPQGPAGPPGTKGLTGPRGRPGKAGSNGRPGIPGVTAWSVKVNGTDDLLIPPSIGNSRYNSKLPIVVHEGENVRLHCSAYGRPQPHITWQRMDNRPINRGSWQDIGISGPTLNITRVHRIHMGIYLCIADNAIPPPTNQTFNVEVHFPPLIKIKNQKVPTRLGSYANLECETEAYPEPLKYWERSDGRLLENNEKYQIEYVGTRESYKSLMKLNITHVNLDDFNYQYYCVSKNEMQTVRGNITLYEGDPRLGFNNGKEFVFGTIPPEKIGLEDICGPQFECPDCGKINIKCNGSGVSLSDLTSRWEIGPYGGKSYPGVPKRNTDCVLYAVGKPVYHRSSEDTYGSWMKDPYPTDSDAEKIWVTKEKNDSYLFQYDNKTMFRRDVPSRIYQLDLPFKGNAHVIYEGHFYYNEKDTARLIKLSLFDDTTSALKLPIESMNETTNLYSSQYNLVDFNIDDNGLWALFAVPNSNNTAIVKIDEKSMSAQYIWNVSVNHHKVGEMFIVCGVLYAVDSITERNTNIRFALDIYKGILLDVNLVFSNPFRKTTMISYNHRFNELYTWDKGNQLTYPVRYNVIDYNVTSKDDKTGNFDPNNLGIQTGYEIL